MPGSATTVSGPPETKKSGSGLTMSPMGPPGNDLQVQDAAINIIMIIGARRVDAAHLTRFVTFLSRSLYIMSLKAVKKRQRSPTRQDIK
jgi:hypothetical protein